jgi:hypothetical protein
LRVRKQYFKPHYGPEEDDEFLAHKREGDRRKKASVYNNLVMQIRE